MNATIVDKRTITNLCQQGHLREARDLCRRYRDANPDDFEAWFILGAIYGGLGDYREAEVCCRRSIAIAPNVPVAHFNLAIALCHQGKGVNGISSFQDAIRLNPKYSDAYYELGKTFKRLNYPREAVGSFLQVLRINLRHEGAFRELRTCELDDSNRELVYRTLSGLHYDHSEFDEAQEYDQKLIELTQSAGAKIRRAIAIPIIPDSVEHIRELRDRVSRELDNLLAEPLHVNEPVVEIARTNFFLAYHGQNDRALQIKFALVCEHACSKLAYRSPHCAATPITDGRRIRVGFISKYFITHSIAKTSRGIMQHLSRDQFEVYALFIGTNTDETSQLIRKHSDHWVVVPEDLEQARKIVAGCKLDILFYQDIGMDSFTYFLAHARLAPVQCTSFGHPDTTGIPNMDYFISTENYEISTSQDHYSENLYLMKDVASCAYYYRPELPESLLSRAAFGFGEEENLYICPQTLFKIHPDFDHVLGGILRKDPQGRIILIDCMHPHWSELLMKRFKRVIGDVVDRIQFVPYQKWQGFINLIAVCDVMLDTVYFCGQNTTHEGFSAGIPIVTCPGDFMRSRHTLSFYRKMGITDCIAGTLSDYINISVRLGTDKEYRERICKLIRERRHLIWEEINVVKEFERFFTYSLEKLSS